MSGMNTAPTGKRHRRWLWISTGIAALLITAVAGFAIYRLAAPEKCESWSDEFTTAVEDGTLADGTFEPSEACAEQLRRDIDLLDRHAD